MIAPVVRMDAARIPGTLRVAMALFDSAKLPAVKLIESFRFHYGTNAACDFAARVLREHRKNRLRWRTLR
jgi:hypothetical protein